MRVKAKRDANEAAIVEALEACGVAVLRVSSPGAPDLLLFDDAARLRWLGRQHQYLPVEIKAVKGRLTDAQQVWRASCAFPVVRSVDDALALVKRA